MTKKKDGRGRKALPPDQKKPPQPTVKINETLYPFVKQLKKEFKANRVSAEKLAKLMAILSDDSIEPTIEKPIEHPDSNENAPDASH